MVRQLAALLNAAGGECFVVLHKLLELGVGLREEGDTLVVQVDITLKRSREADAARIYGDCGSLTLALCLSLSPSATETLTDVELAQHLVAKRHQRFRQGLRRNTSRPTIIDEEVTLDLAAGEV